MSSIERVVIVGAGLAGARAAEGLRKSGYDGAIALLGDEPQRPYVRPPLSKEYLRDGDRDAVFVHPETYYVEHRIDLHSSATARAIVPASREVVLADERRLPYDRLLLATGAGPRSLSVPGADLRGVRTVRTLADVDALREEAAHAERVVVVGAGWLGSELAASLRMLGRRVAMIGPGSVPLERSVGPEIGAVYRDLHREHGVELRLGTHVARIVGRECVEWVETSAGERLRADLVVVAIGVDARAELATDAGLAVDDGIAVDARLETSVPGIFAAGDVAAAWHPFYGRRLRIEHWANARFGGTAAASGMLGGTQPYDRIPSLFSDQYDLSMESVGLITPDARLVVRGDLAAREFTAFWLVGDRLVAGLTANVHGLTKTLERLIRSRVVVEPEALADPSVELDAPPVAA